MNKTIITIIATLLCVASANAHTKHVSGKVFKEYVNSGTTWYNWPTLQYENDGTFDIEADIVGDSLVILCDWTRKDYGDTLRLVYDNKGCITKINGQEMYPAYNYVWVSTNFNLDYGTSKNNNGCYIYLNGYSYLYADETYYHILLSCYSFNGYGNSGGYVYYYVELEKDPSAPGDGEEYGSGGGSGALVLGEDMTEQTLAGYVGKTQDAHLLRTFYKDGSINTICLPFSLSEEQLAESPLKGYAKLQRVSSASVKDAGYDSQSLDLTLTDVTSIEAGAPYIISWTEGEDLVDPLFENVTITTAGPAQTASTGGVAFRGTFTPKSVTAGDKGVMFVGSDGQISWPETDDIIKGFRCWFSIDK